MNRRAPHRYQRRSLLAAIFGGVLVWGAVGAMALISIQNVELIALAALGIGFTGLLGLLALRLRRLADIDTLTGLVGHAGFHEALATALWKARRESSTVSLVSVDLDDFKHINDNHGHPYGDEVLRAVAKGLQASVRGGDTVGRVGGEEFAVLLPETDGKEAYEIAERARASVATVPVFGTRLSCSAGIAVYPVDADDMAGLVRLSDSALYSAKHSGKDRTRRFDRDRVPFAGDERQTDEINRILERGDAIVPVYQPVVSLTTGRVVGYEALARFPDHPGWSPAAWFAQAHACGLGPQLEAAALRAAIDCVDRPLGTHLSLNISPSALSSAPVKAALPQDLTDIVIELTEHEALSDDLSLDDALGDLRRRGARIAIDDAGAGYAGLKSVVWIRPDVVKLDRGLIHAIHTDSARVALVESFVRFARRVGAVVCAEGIETIEDLTLVANLDVQLGQGFALARPGPPWARVSDGAAEACRSALSHALAAGAGPELAAGDRGLEHISARLGAAHSREDLYGALGLIAAELNADKIALSRIFPEAGIIETLAESGAQPEHERFDLSEFPLTAEMAAEQKAVQVIVEDPASDPAEVKLLLDLSFKSVLMVPVVHRGKTIGMIEAFAAEKRAWSRTEINRARIISNQFASVIELFLAREESAGSQGLPSDS